MTFDWYTPVTKVSGQLKQVGIEYDRQPIDPQPSNVLAVMGPIQRLDANNFTTENLFIDHAVEEDI